MKVIFLGTGMAAPTRWRWHPTVMVNYNGENILFDCGEGVQIRLIEKRLGIMKIDKIFLTHYHGDHIVGLPGLVQSMGLYGRIAPLHIFGPEGIKKLIDFVLEFSHHYVAFNVHGWEIKKNQRVLESENYEIYAARANHVTKAFAYAFKEKDRLRFDKKKCKKLGLAPSPLYKKLERGETVKIKGQTIRPEDVMYTRPGLKIVYSGDTRPCKEIIELAKGANLLIHEASFGKDMAERADEVGHSTAEQAAQVAKKAGVEKLVLMHVSPRYNDGQFLLEEAKKVFKNTVLAKDLMEIEL